MPAVTPPAAIRPPANPWKQYAFLGGLVVIIGATLALRWSQARLASTEVVIDGRWTVRAMVADTPDKQARGLAVVKALAPEEGMYFVFNQPDYYAFWMKDMKFPIDILWIRDRQLVDMTTDVPAESPGAPLPTYRPMVPADRVLEVPAGYAQGHGLKLGMTVAVRIDTSEGVR